MKRLTEKQHATKFHYVQHYDRNRYTLEELESEKEILKDEINRIKKFFNPTKFNSEAMWNAMGEMENMILLLEAIEHMIAYRKM